eukprot:UN06797
MSDINDSDVDSFEKECTDKMDKAIQIEDAFVQVDADNTSQPNQTDIDISISTRRTLNPGCTKETTHFATNYK